MADIEEKIAKTEEEIRQLQNRKRKLLNQRKNEERKAKAFAESISALPLIQGK